MVDDSCQEDDKNVDLLRFLARMKGCGSYVVDSETRIRSHVAVLEKILSSGPLVLVVKSCAYRFESWLSVLGYIHLSPSRLYLTTREHALSTLGCPLARCRPRWCSSFGCKSKLSVFSWVVCSEVISEVLYCFTVFIQFKTRMAPELAT
jgi:hypothetical protein